MGKKVSRFSAGLTRPATHAWLSLSHLNVRRELKYIELLGMGASGKTTSLKHLRSMSCAKYKSPKIELEESIGSVIRRAVGEVPLDGRIKGAILDSWAHGTLDRYPALFSQVLQVVCDVADDDRKRLILLNYWRSRVRLFSRVVEDSDFGLLIVDEGLSQTALSTLWAQDQKSRGDTRLLAGRLSGLVDSLPDRRCVIVLETPIDELMKRRKKNRVLGNEALLETCTIMNQIAERSAKNGCDVRRVDGLGTPREVAERISKALPKT